MVKEGEFLGATIGIQEAKVAEVEWRLDDFLWGSNEFGFAAKGSNGRAGGLLTIENTKVLSKKNVIIGDHFVCVEGSWGQEGNQVYVVMYMPLETLLGRGDCGEN